jgi:hypothetical protein
MLKTFADIPHEGTAQRYVLTTPTSAVTIESGTRKVVPAPNSLMFAEDILRLGEGPSAHPLEAEPKPLKGACEYRKPN